MRDSKLIQHARNNNSKDTISRTQRQAVYRFFASNCTTMFDAEKQTGICRPNICRHVRSLEDDGLIERIGRSDCPVSGCRAWYFQAKKGGANE